MTLNLQEDRLGAYLGPSAAGAGQIDRECYVTLIPSQHRELTN